MKTTVLYKKLLLVGKSMAVEHYFSTSDLDGGDSPVFAAQTIQERADCFDAVVAFVATLSEADANDRDYGSVVDELFGDDVTTKPKNLPGIAWEAFEDDSAADLLHKLQCMKRNVLYNAQDAGILEPNTIDAES